MASMPQSSSYPCFSRCGSLNENDLYRLLCLENWSPVGETIWKGLGGLALLEKVYHWGERALRSQNPPPFPVGSLCLWIICKLSAIAPHHTCLWLPPPHTMMDMTSHSLEVWGPKLNAVFYKLAWPWCFVISIERKLRHAIDSHTKPSFLHGCFRSYYTASTSPTELSPQPVISIFK